MTVSVTLDYADIERILSEWCADNYGPVDTLTFLDVDDDEITELSARVSLKEPNLKPATT